MAANDTQVGGNHYAKHGHLQHWDIVHHFGLDYFQGQVTKYVMRHKDKGGVQDLKKAAHFLAKYIELIEQGGVHPDSAELLPKVDLITEPPKVTLITATSEPQEVTGFYKLHNYLFEGCSMEYVFLRCPVCRKHSTVRYGELPAAADHDPSCPRGVQQVVVAPPNIEVAVADAQSFAGV